MRISGFTFIHNAITGGYPLKEAIQSVVPFVDELVIVDMESTDGTTDWLETIVTSPFCPVRIINGQWGNDAGKTLAAAHSLHTECTHDNILHFEADEVFDQNQLEYFIPVSIKPIEKNVLFYRIQVEQNFQRIRWYPELVHRFFQKGQVTKNGHTTHEHDEKNMFIVPMEEGLLWDCTNCFRDNFMGRHRQQEELWHKTPTRVKGVPDHFSHDSLVLSDFFNKPHWTWTKSPFNLPPLLKPLVGKERYILE